MQPCLSWIWHMMHWTLQQKTHWQQCFTTAAKQYPWSILQHCCVPYKVTIWHSSLAAWQHTSSGYLLKYHFKRASELERQQIRSEHRFKCLRAFVFNPLWKKTSARRLPNRLVLVPHANSCKWILSAFPRQPLCVRWKSSATGQYFQTASNNLLQPLCCISKWMMGAELHFFFLRDVSFFQHRNACLLLRQHSQLCT